MEWPENLVKQMGQLGFLGVAIGEEYGGAAPDGVRMVDVNRLRPLPNQPRKTFRDDALDELAESIKSRGMLQPIVVRDPEHDGHYEIIAGERRWRAAQKAQIHQVPVIIREFDDVTALEIAIIENIQREQLNAWEEGEAVSYTHLDVYKRQVRGSVYYRYKK